MAIGRSSLEPREGRGALKVNFFLGRVEVVILFM
jgi:hypothetical protein